MKIRMTIIILHLLIIAMLASYSFAQTSSSYLIEAWSILNVAGTSNSSSYQLQESAFGEFALGSSSSSSYLINGGMIVTSFDSYITTNDIIPNTFKLFQNYPNPFNPTTTIRYDIPQQSQIKLKIYDSLGREILTLVDELKYPGSYDVNFNANGLSSGIYYYRIETAEFAEIKKMILLK